MFYQQRPAAYRLIVNEIGKKWRELGRELGLSEGQLDAIDAKHSEAMGDKVHALLALFEQRTHQRELCGNLLAALEKVRRKDLARGVQKILSH